MGHDRRARRHDGPLVRSAAQPAAAPLVTGIHVFTFNEFTGAEEWRLKLRRDVGLG
ncbi:MAG: hypothetical protein LCH82_15515 [Actinobacteria bacterium]|nr:hypothetical protein [Actinomycetota bacterium]HRW02500.1 hypothetical protein [Tetrasphaera sp.]